MGVFAYDMLRAAIESTLEDTADIYECSGTEVDENGQTVPQKKCLYKDVPCRLSRGGMAVNELKNVLVSDGAAKLYTLPEVEIPNGSIIVVKKAGKTWQFKRSRYEMRYQSHTEYGLELDGTVL